MDIVITHEQGRKPVTVFQITGTVDSSTATDLEKQIKQAHEAGMRDLLLDLSKTEYVSSAGIRVLNSTMKMLRSDAPEESDEAMSKGLRDGTWKSPHLKLAHVPRYVSEAFKIAGMDMLLEYYDDTRKAIDSF